MPRLPWSQNVTTNVRWASTARLSPQGQAYKSVHRSVKPTSEASQAPKQQPSVSVRWQALPWVLSSLVAGGLGLYSVQIYLAASKPCRNAAIVDLTQQKDVAARYDVTADSFDSDVEFSEILMRVHGIRRRLAEKCQGHVLEVSCGTGRNLGYYDILRDGKVESLTCVDLSPQMVEMCKKKWDSLMSSKKDKLKPGLSVRFLTGNALAPMPLAPGQRRYDTIIQTMGLCSTPSPSALLTNMAKHLDMNNPDARILLLEHGRSYMPWLNNVLDNAAEKHAEIHGCWFNRDIGSLVEAAAERTGLELASERRYHFGTTSIFELKPSSKLFLTAAAPTEPKQTEDPAASSRGWRLWFGTG